MVMLSFVRSIAGRDGSAFVHARRSREGLRSGSIAVAAAIPVRRVRVAMGATRWPIDGRAACPAGCGFFRSTRVGPSAPAACSIARPHAHAGFSTWTAGRRAAPSPLREPGRSFLHDRSVRAAAGSRCRCRKDRCRPRHVDSRLSASMLVRRCGLVPPPCLQSPHGRPGPGRGAGCGGSRSTSRAATSSPARPRRRSGRARTRSAVRRSKRSARPSIRA